MELDNIDKNIIYELGENSRKSYKEIARKINSKKEVVAYRINSLIERGIITKFVPVFALSKLGIFSSKIYLRLQGLNKKAEENIYLYLLKNKDVAWVAKSVGRWDLLLGFYSKNIIEFAKIKQKILSKFSKYIKDYDITHIEDALVFNRDYLISGSTSYREEFVFSGETGEMKLSKQEAEIINKIKNNGRFQAVEAAKELGLDARTVLKKVKSLERKGILQGFTVFLDLKKLGLQLHKLCISLQNYDEGSINKLLNFLKQNPNTIHLIKSLGSWEFEVEIESGSLPEIYEYINQIKNTFPNLIKQIDLVTITDEMKLDFFPSDYSKSIKTS